jgi:hypothetical protein
VLSASTSGSTVVGLALGPELVLLAELLLELMSTCPELVSESESLLDREAGAMPVAPGAWLPALAEPKALNVAYTSSKTTSQVLTMLPVLSLALCGVVL